MNYSAEQVVKGLMKYADNEMMGKLPTSGKWIVGTAMNLASNKVENLIDALTTNTIINMLGIVDEDGNIDVDALITAMKSSAEKYGKLTVDVPLVGSLTFAPSDIDILRTYIN